MKYCILCIGLLLGSCFLDEGASQNVRQTSSTERDDINSISSSLQSHSSPSQRSVESVNSAEGPIVSDIVAEHMRQPKPLF